MANQLRVLLYKYLRKKLISQIAKKNEKIKKKKKIQIGLLQQRINLIVYTIKSIQHKWSHKQFNPFYFTCVMVHKLYITSVSVVQMSL